jgi:hypothetical protein
MNMLKKAEVTSLTTITVTIITPVTMNTEQKITFGKHLAWALSKRTFLDDKIKWNVAWENLLSLGWIARTSLTTGRTDNLYSVSGQFLDVSTVLC